MRGVIPASASRKFSRGRGLAPPVLTAAAKADGFGHLVPAFARFTLRKIFRRVLHPFFRLQSLHLLQPLCVLKTLPRPTASATLSRASPPGPAKIFAGVSFGHIVPGFARFTLRKILQGVLQTALYKYVG